MQKTYIWRVSSYSCNVVSGVLQGGQFYIVSNWHKWFTTRSIKINSWYFADDSTQFAQRKGSSLTHGLNPIDQWCRSSKMAKCRVMFVTSKQKMYHCTYFFWSSIQRLFYNSLAFSDAAWCNYSTSSSFSWDKQITNGFNKCSIYLFPLFLS